MKWSMGSSPRMFSLTRRGTYTPRDGMRDITENVDPSQDNKCTDIYTHTHSMWATWLPKQVFDPAVTDPHSNATSLSQSNSWTKFSTTPHHTTPLTSVRLLKPPKAVPFHERPVTSWKGRVEISAPAGATPITQDSPLEQSRAVQSSTEQCRARQQDI